MKRIPGLILILCIGLVAGCAPAPATPIPPTWTLTPPPGNLAPTPTQPVNIEVVAPPTRVLPPTWTPLPDYTETPVPMAPAFLSETPVISPTPPPSPTFDYLVPPTPLLGAVTLPAECANLQFDKEASSAFFVPLNGGMRIVWKPLENVDQYWIWIRHPDGRYIVRQALETTLIDVRSPGTGVGLFNVEGVYPIAVVAFRDGVQVCQQLTDIIIVRAG
jgi:hypothetical protein